MITVSFFTALGGIEWAAAARQAGDVSVLPRRVLLHGRLVRLQELYTGGVSHLSVLGLYHRPPHPILLLPPRPLLLRHPRYSATGPLRRQRDHHPRAGRDLELPRPRPAPVATLDPFSLRLTVPSARTPSTNSAPTSPAPSARCSAARPLVAPVQQQSLAAPRRSAVRSSAWRCSSRPPRSLLTMFVLVATPGAVSLCDLILVRPFPKYEQLGIGVGQAFRRVLWSRPPSTSSSSAKSLLTSTNRSSAKPKTSGPSPLQ